LYSPCSLVTAERAGRPELAGVNFKLAPGNLSPAPLVELTLTVPCSMLVWARKVWARTACMAHNERTMNRANLTVQRRAVPGRSLESACSLFWYDMFIPSSISVLCPMELITTASALFAHVAPRLQVLANRPIKRPRLMWSTALVVNDQKVGAAQLNEGFYGECRGVFFEFLLECALFVLSFRGYHLNSISSTSSSSWRKTAILNNCTQYNKRRLSYLSRLDSARKGTSS
jgi:hypothetical protein